MISINSKEKGKRGELELAHELKKDGYTDVRRTVQYSGRTDDGAADLVGLPSIHIECKRVEKLNMEQAVRDHADGEMPAVFHRRNRGEWMVTMRLEDWIRLYKGNSEWLNHFSFAFPKCHWMIP